MAGKERQDFEQADPGKREPTTDEQAEAETLREEYEALGDEDWERAQTIDSRLDALEQALEYWPDSILATGGAIIALGHRGVEIVRGLIRSDDARIEEAASEEGDGSSEAPESQGSSLSAALIEDLTAHKTAALRAELAHSPALALALVVHALAGSVFYRCGSGVLKLWISPRSLKPSIKGHDACRAVLDLERSRERIGNILPGQQADLWAWCLNASQADLLDVLAVASAYGLDAVVSKSEANGRGVEHGEALAQALKLDIRQWWTPTADGYFSRVGKTTILSDLVKGRQAPAAPSWEKMKKGDLAVLAEREIADTGWLPALLR